MTLLVTGADGFTGRYVTEAAVKAGMNVVALTADLTDAEAVAAQVSQINPTRVLHLAAISFVGHKDARGFYDVNLFGTLNLLEALKHQTVRPLQVLLASSANIYGNTTNSPIAENQPPAPVNHYAMSKLSMEFMARNYSDSLPLVITRPFNYTGPGQALSFVIPKLVEHFALRKPVVELGNLDVEREFNDIRYVSDVYLKLLECGIPGEAYNVCSGQPFTLKYVIQVLEELSGHVMDVQVNPAFVRPNEVHCLCGDPAKLEAAVGLRVARSLRDTLTWMLSVTTGGRP